MADAVLQPAPVSTTAPLPARWSLGARILFRFACVYLVLYCWPYSGRSNLFDAIPNFGIGSMNDDDTLGLTKLVEAPWKALCPWVAVHVFHLQGDVTKYHPTGSGDTTLDYVQVFCFAAIAGGLALVWSLADRRRPNYITLYAWLRLLVRFTLAFTLLSYGFAKAFPLQFRPPFMMTLSEPYGESSPMGILWTFMGASTAYTMFCGWAEVTGGVLLLFRRTAVIGALVAFADMLNVALLNFCYDVPVKLYSAHLVMMSLFLLLPDAAALLRFFLFHQPARLEGLWLPPFQRRWLRIGAVAFQALVIVSVLYNNIWGGYKNLKQSASTYFKHAPLYGAWNADNFTSDGSFAHWQQLAIDFPNGLFMRDMQGRRTYFQSTYNESKHTVQLKSNQLKLEGDFTYQQSDNHHLLLRGTLDGHSLTAEFHRIDDQYLLTHRGFHWINEYPYNR